MPTTAAPFRVGGALSIDGVTPGGGLLPSGAGIRIAGNGFEPAAIAQVEGVPLASVAFVSPHEVDVRLAAPADLTGRRVLVTNPDGKSADFYPALSGKKTYRGYNSAAVVQPISPSRHTLTPI